MSDNIHPDFEQIMREAEENLVGSAKTDMLNDFKALEHCHVASSLALIATKCALI